MDNPFESFDKRLLRLEELVGKILDIVSCSNIPIEDVMGDINLAVEITKLKRSTIYSHVHTGKIPFIKKNGKLYFSKSDLLKWLKGEDVQEQSKGVVRPLFDKTLKRMAKL